MVLSVWVLMWVSAVSSNGSFRRVNQALEEPGEPWVLNQGVDVQC